MPGLKVFDTHCHLNMPPLAEDWQKIWQEAQSLGVRQAMVVGANLETSRKAAEIAESDENLWAAAGIHPSSFYEKEDGGEYTKQEITAELKKEILEKMAAEIAEMKKWPSKKIAAVGECGLEYFRIKERTDFAQIREIQRQLLTWQIEWGQAEKKTLIFHLRDETTQVFTEIEEIMKKVESGVKMILHCVSCPADFLKTALQNPDVYVSFAGNVTFKNAKNLQELVPLVPKNRLLVETDAPFLSPVPYRGVFPCVPKYVINTAEFLRDNYKVDLEQIYQNSWEAFNL